MFNLDELVKNEEIQLNGEVLNIRPITKRYADRFTQITSKMIKATNKVGMNFKNTELENVTQEEMEKLNKVTDELQKLNKELDKMLLEFLNNNEENKEFKFDDLENMAKDKVNRLVAFIAEQINSIEKK